MAQLLEIVDFFKQLQNRICIGLEEWDGQARFKEDLWKRAGGGGGRSRIIENGKLFEKGGVNFSHISGSMPDNIAEKLQLPIGTNFHASGVSIVIHPQSPHIPIIHKNIRYFEMEDGRYWFGGGIDLTPAYINMAQAVAFHQQLKACCDSFAADYYPRFKKWCDDYFYIKHRKEARGVGGLFFDHLSSKEPLGKQRLFDFVMAVGNSFLMLYQPLVFENRDKKWSAEEKEWQLMRRSRYVEFNLVYDKGTKFGLDTDGRIESILMSMPPLAKWTYNYQPEPGSREAETLSLLKPTDWLALKKSE